jgi:SOS-response transcriptional repressor LexA
MLITERIENTDEIELYLRVKKLLFQEQSGHNFAEKRLFELKELSKKINSDFYKNALDDFIYYDNNSEYTGNIFNITNTKFLANQKIQSIINFLFSEDDENTTDDTIQALNLHNGNFALCVVDGDSMTGANIFPGCELLIEKTHQPIDNQIIIAEVNSRFFVKRIRFIENQVWLISENKNYEPYKVKSNDRFSVYGVVKKIIFNPI